MSVEFFLSIKKSNVTGFLYFLDKSTVLSFNGVQISNF